MAESRNTSQSVRLRTWLRRNTHWRNTDEFFLAILFEVGAPPLPISESFINGNISHVNPHTLPLWMWRKKVADRINEHTHHSIDPGHTMKEYLRWLFQKQESGAISRP